MASTFGFHSLSEPIDTECDIEGSLPDWLDGRLYRNGPGTFRTADGEVEHWFDGFAMVRSFDFGGESVRFRTRVLDTDAYQSAQEGRFTGFASGGAGLLERLRALLFGDPYDNTNIVVERVGDEFVALTETPRWVRIDPETLDTLGDIQPTDGPVGDLACAHLQHDPWTGETLSFETEFGRTCSYHCFAYQSSTERSLIGSVPVDEPAYMHSFAVTRNYIVLTEFPFVVNPLAFLRPGKRSFIDSYRWDPDRGIRLRVIDRRSGELVASPTTETRFGFHHVNAYEPAGESATIVFDLETVPDASSLEQLSLSWLRSSDYQVPVGRLRRYRLTLDEAAEGGARVDSDLLYDRAVGLPTISPAVRMRRHRYVYGQGGPLTATDWPRSIVKVDTETGEGTIYDPDASVTEPVFVPAPADARTSEDDGVVLVVLLDASTESSRLVVLDGPTMTERATVELPVALPFSFHGRYFPLDQDATGTDGRA